MGKYEEALERAKAGKPIDEVFPELKESEDEKIRKYIVKFVELEKGVNLPPDDADKMLAYLEKQKEQKHKEPGYKHEDYFCEKCQANAFNAGRESVLKEQKPVEWRPIDNEYMTKLCEIIDGYDAERQWKGAIKDWLKSLRPQPHWKPSEEQMDALNDCVSKARGIHNASVGGYDAYRILVSLYDDLYKLL